MKKLTKLLFLIPLTITPLISTSCSTKKEIISSKKETINRDRYIGEIKANIDILIEKIQQKEKKQEKNQNTSEYYKLIEVKEKIQTYFLDISNAASNHYKDILDELKKQINKKTDSELIEISIKLNDILSCL